MQKNPDARAFFSIKESSKLKFKFPQPGPIDGVKSRSKALMKMTNCDFTYPGNTKPTLFNISCQVSMASRVGCVGENGAGKSTMIKVLDWRGGATDWRCIFAPQRSCGLCGSACLPPHREPPRQDSNEYIRWRYSNGEDKESLVKVSMVATEEEKKLQTTPFEVTWRDENMVQRKAKKIVAELLGTRRDIKGKGYEYDVKYRDGSEEPALDVKTLERQGWGKNCKAIDARIAQTNGLVLRALSSANVEGHLKDCGLDPEFATSLPHVGPLWRSEGQGCHGCLNVESTSYPHSR